MVYLTLKQLHIAVVGLSLAGFLLRGVWMLRGSPLLRHRLTRILPHFNDSLLLATGVSLAWLTHQSPLQQPWLAAKLTALLLYILLGTVALKRGRSRGIRIVSFAAALATAGYMIGVASSRTAWPFR
jgi:uncharacterized membrane protein SirB2